MAMLGKTHALVEWDKGDNRLFKQEDKRWEVVFNKGKKALPCSEVLVHLTQMMLLLFFYGI